MAKQQGQFKFTGTIGNLTGWRDKNGVYHVKTKSSLNKEKIMRYPSMAGQRKAMDYFGLASTTASEIRRSLQPLINQFADKQLQDRLTKLCAKMLQRSHPEECPKTYDFSALTEKIEGIRLRKEACVFQFASETILEVSDADEGWLDLSIGNWNIPDALIEKAGATHLKWHVCIAPLMAKPLTKVPKKIITSDWMDIQQPTPWKCEFHYSPFLTKDGAVIIALALETAVWVSGEYYTTETIRAMNILKVIA